MKTLLSSKLKKSILFLCVAVLGFSSLSSAQRYCYVDTQYILDAIPEYANSQLEIDRLSVEWQNQIEAKFVLVDKKRKDYEAEAILLPAEIKKQREIEEILEKIKLNRYYLQKFLEIKNLAEEKKVHILNEPYHVVQSCFNCEMHDLRIKLCELRGE